MRIAIRYYMVACPARAETLNADLADCSQAGGPHSTVPCWQPQRLRLFKESAHPWAWLHLARPAPDPPLPTDLGGQHVSGVSATSSYAEHAAPLERLPLEILTLILAEVSKGAYPERTLFAVALSSPLLWPVVLDLVRSCTRAVSAPWAGLPIALTDNWSRRWPGPDRGSIPLADAESAAAAAAAPSSPTSGSFSPRKDKKRTVLSTSHDFRESEWIGYVSSVLDSAPLRKLRRTGQQPSRSVKKPLSSIDTSDKSRSLLAAFKQNLSSITVQSWTQPWLLRNISKGIVVQLTPVKLLRSANEVKHAKKVAYPAEPRETRIMPPRLHLSGAEGHKGSACGCAVAVEDLLSYYIMCFEIPILTPYKGDAVPPDHGEWAGDRFDIVCRDEHELERGAEPGRNGGWRDATDEMKDRFAAMIVCRPKSGYGEPGIPDRDEA